MRQMIQSRNGKPPAVSSIVKENHASSDGAEKAFAVVDEYGRKMAELVEDAESHLKHALENHEQLQTVLGALGLEQVCHHSSLIVSWRLKHSVFQAPDEVSRLQGEVVRAKRQCDLVKKLLADASAENEIMYDVSSLDVYHGYGAHSLPS